MSLVLNSKAIDQLRYVRPSQRIIEFNRKRIFETSRDSYSDQILMVSVKHWLT